MVTDIENTAAEDTAQEQKETAPTEGQNAEKQLESLRAELKEQQNKYLYLYAEFENYKKRVFKERSDLLKFGHVSFVRELLQVSDNLDRALQHVEGADKVSNYEGLASGIKMVNHQLKETLSKFGVAPLSALGQKFNPELHEAVGQKKITLEEQGPAKAEDGQVVEEHQKGYMLHGRLLRPARVVVATK